ECAAGEEEAAETGHQHPEWNESEKSSQEAGLQPLLLFERFARLDDPENLATAPDRRRDGPHGLRRYYDGGELLSPGSCRVESLGVPGRIVVKRRPGVAVDRNEFGAIEIGCR